MRLSSEGELATFPVFGVSGTAADAAGDGCTAATAGADVTTWLAFAKTGRPDVGVEHYRWTLAD